mmetsp:Transcript_9187/g.14493  ORF Transcript_9187/g.14493 Transcript_9187/m.14493 type:complete len:268 (+) Transcript_9187:268-1071(+)
MIYLFPLNSLFFFSKKKMERTDLLFHGSRSFFFFHEAFISIISKKKTISILNCIFFLDRSFSSKTSESHRVFHKSTNSGEKKIDKLKISPITTDNFLIWRHSQLLPNYLSEIVFIPFLHEKFLDIQFNLKFDPYSKIDFKFSNPFFENKRNIFWLGLNQRNTRQLRTRDFFKFFENGLRGKDKSIEVFSSVFYPKLFIILNLNIQHFENYPMSQRFWGENYKTFFFFFYFNCLSIHPLYDFNWMTFKSFILVKSLIKTFTIHFHKKN